MNFNYKQFSSTTHFGIGKVSLLPGLIQPFERVMVIAGRSGDKLVFEVVSQAREKNIIRFSKVIQHVPEDLVNEALQELHKHDSQLLVAIGGGSSIGLAKALALQTHLPIYSVPTTYAGSEQTDIWGMTVGDNKKTGRAEHVLPKVVIYDPNLTATMPKSLAVTSAMNAMAHLMEAIYSDTGNPITSHIALLGIKAIKEGLEKFGDDGSLSVEVNEKLLFGAYLGGKCLSEVSMSLHHKAAHVLGGSFNLDHATVHTVLQPYVLAYQWSYLDHQTRIAFINALASDYPPIALKALAENSGAVSNLKDLGFKREDIERAAALIASASFQNPGPVTKDSITELLENAFDGNLSKSL